MMKTGSLSRVLFVWAAVAAMTATGDVRTESVRPFISAKASWRMFERRLGLFVHWGIYSAGGLHEQEQMRYGRSREEYNRRMKEFTAEKFTGDNLVDAAEMAGAEYIDITTKHHDGFCLWDT